MIKLISNDIWDVIRNYSRKTQKSKVATAYLTSNAFDKVPLKKGDILLVAMCKRNLECGSVNPYEVEKYYNKEVKIYNLDNLHAKIFLFGNIVVIGSSNLTSNSENLVEAGIITDSSKVILAAKQFFKENCIEPISIGYINLCKKWYKPPTFSGIKGKKKSTKFNGQLSNLWVLNTHPIKGDTTKDDILFENKKNTFNKHITDKTKYKINRIFYPLKHRVIANVKKGDMIIEIHKDKTNTEVYYPCRVIGIIKNKKTNKAQLLYEDLIKSKSKPWKSFEKILKDNKIINIKKTSTRNITNEYTKKVILKCFA